MENITKYRKYKNILHSCLKQAEENFYQSIFSEKHKGITHFWKAFGETLNAKKRKTTYKLQKLIIENQVVTDENDIVNGLNNYFCSIGQKLSSQIPTTAKHFESYLRNKVQEAFFLAPVICSDTRGFQGTKITESQKISWARQFITQNHQNLWRPVHDASYYAVQ